MSWSSKVQNGANCANQKKEKRHREWICEIQGAAEPSNALRNQDTWIASTKVKKAEVPIPWIPP